MSSWHLEGQYFETCNTRRHAVTSMHPEWYERTEGGCNAHFAPFAWNGSRKRRAFMRRYT